MKRSFFINMLICVCAAAGALAQTPAPATTAGQVCRVIQFGTRPGRNAEFTRFRREHLKPILGEQKKQGLILSYAFYSKPVSNGPDDWDIAQITCFRNYADAIDFNAERAAKFDDISLKHYGSSELMNIANSRLVDMRVIFSSFLMREQIHNPLN
jgi:hypothetical protein